MERPRESWFEKEPDRLEQGDALGEATGGVYGIRTIFEGVDGVSINYTDRGVAVVAVGRRQEDTSSMTVKAQKSSTRGRQQEDSKQE